ncbi:hypothetical protein Plhal304r1_c061g0148151 [Plasmopara halstedii]
MCVSYKIPALYTNQLVVNGKNIFPSRKTVGKAYNTVQWLLNMFATKKTLAQSMKNCLTAKMVR